MNRAFLATFLGALLLLVGACKSKTDNKDAIRDGVMKHIAGMNGMNVNNMNVTVTQATINGDKAQANVDIRAKNADPNAPAMQLVYQLQKHREESVGVKGEPAGGVQHFSPGDIPPASLPPGHAKPSGTSGAGGQMPSAHPDFNSILNTAQPQGQQGQQAPASTPPPPAQKPASNYTKP